MKIGTEEGGKLEQIFEVLEFSKKDRVEHMEKIGQALLMDVAAEAFLEKPDVVESDIADKDGLAEFLLANFSEEEIKEMTDRVFRDAVVEYFAKALKNVPDEARAKAEDILGTMK